MNLVENGRNLKEFIINEGRTTKWISARSGVSESEVNAFLYGSSFNPNSLGKLANLFGFDLEDFSNDNYEQIKAMKEELTKSLQFNKEEYERSLEERNIKKRNLEKELRELGLIRFVEKYTQSKLISEVVSETLLEFMNGDK